MTISLGDVETTALIPVAIKASETSRKNPRVRDEVAVEMIKNLGIDTAPYDKFMSHEGEVLETVLEGAPLWRFPVSALICTLGMTLSIFGYPGSCLSQWRRNIFPWQNGLSLC